MANNNVRKNVPFSPAMQMAYLRSLSRSSGAGFVNPHRRASLEVAQQTRGEAERLRRLDEAGIARKRSKKAHGEEASFREQASQQRQKEFTTQQDLMNRAFEQRQKEFGERIGLERDYLGEQQRRQGIRSQLFRDEMESIRKGSNISNLISLGTLGLGIHDASKTRAAAKEEAASSRDLMKMQLDYLRRNDPEHYKWYVNQPHTKRQLKKHQISIENEQFTPKGIR